MVRLIMVFFDKKTVKWKNFIKLLIRTITSFKSSKLIINFFNIEMLQTREIFKIQKNEAFFLTENLYCLFGWIL